MNVITETRVPVAAPHPTHTFKVLLKREFWEHKGGFLWAPMVTGAIFLLMTSMAMIASESLRRSTQGDDEPLTMNGVKFSQLTKTLSPAELAEMGGGIDIGVLLAGTWPFIALAFVVFFYCLGALYDERKDRSILFWKSLPLSDAQTVLSKVASALLVAPLLATAAAMLTSIGFLAILSVFTLYHGGNPIEMIWGPASPLKIFAIAVGSLPIFALWAMPTIGWLLLVSAWSKTKPFLWALLIPVFSGVLVSWFDVMQLFGLKAAWFWQHVVGRLLLGTVNGIDLIYRNANNPAIANFNPDSPKDIVELFSLSNAYGALAMPELWIGVLAGAAMIFGAIRLRRWRDDG